MLVEPEKEVSDHWADWRQQIDSRRQFRLGRSMRVPRRRRPRTGAGAAERSARRLAPESGRRSNPASHACSLRSPARRCPRLCRTCATGKRLPRAGRRRFAGALRSGASDLEAATIDRRRRDDPCVTAGVVSPRTSRTRNDVRVLARWLVVERGLSRLHADGFEAGVGFFAEPPPHRGVGASAVNNPGRV
jgi:hypothetical protein